MRTQTLKNSYGLRGTRDMLGFQRFFVGYLEKVSYAMRLAFLIRFILYLAVNRKG